MWAFVKWLYLVALVVWIGEIVFFSFIVAPGLFRTFPTTEAGRAVAAIFPTYYRIGYVCGAVLMISCVGWLVGAESRATWGIASVLSAAMLGATLYAGVVIQPRATALRPQLHEAEVAPGVKDEFDRLHRTAVILNGAVLLGGVVLSIITAARLRP